RFVLHHDCSRNSQCGELSDRQRFRDRVCCGRCGMVGMPNKQILLLEPGYRNKYPPLGLMKIAQYHGPFGKRDHVTFAKGPDPSLTMRAWDRVYITTLFSFEYQKIAETVDFALDATLGESQRIFVGGIAASLMHARFLAEPRWRGIR